MKRQIITYALLTIIAAVYSQSVEIKDSSDESLLIVNDEGTDQSSITIPTSETAPTSTTSKLYNEGGTLKWNGVTLATGSSLWTISGDNVHRNIGNVGIGTTNPISELSVGGNGHTFVTIYGEASTGTIGVHGYASNSVGSNFGGYFKADGELGRGVYGHSAHSSGINYGVMGRTESPNGWAGYFEGRGYFSGDLGLGTDNPDESLHISYNMRLDGSFEDKDGEPGMAGQILSSTGTGTDWIAAPSVGSSLWTLNGSDIYYNDGKVGIGTSIPGVELDIMTSQVDWASRLRLGNADNTHNLFLSSGHSGQMPFISFNENDALLFSMWDGSNNERVRITSDGNVGISTTNPLAKLSVVGNTVNSTDDLQNTAIYGETSNIAGRAVYGNATSTTDTNYGGYFTSAGPDGIGVLGLASSEAFGFNIGGYFEARGRNGYGVRGIATGEYGIGVLGYASNEGESGKYGGYFYADGNNSVGIYGQAHEGTNSTGVQGRGSEYDFDAVGQGVNYGASSSIRWKRNIVVIDNPLEKINQIRGIYFDWDEEHGGQHDVGCIAEEVGKVFPEIVVYEENGIDADGMDYSKLTPLLVEVAKAQKKLIEDLTKRIEYLENN